MDSRTRGIASRDAMRYWWGCARQTLPTYRSPRVPQSRSSGVATGEWDSLHDYAEDYAESTGLNDAADKAGSPYVTVDVDALERDLDIEMYTAASDHHTVYVFDPAA